MAGGESGWQDSRCGGSGTTSSRLRCSFLSECGLVAGELVAGPRRGCRTVRSSAGMTASACCRLGKMVSARSSPRVMMASSWAETIRIVNSQSDGGSSTITAASGKVLRTAQTASVSAMSGSRGSRRTASGRQSAAVCRIAASVFAVRMSKCISRVWSPNRLQRRCRTRLSAATTRMSACLVPEDSEVVEHVSGAIMAMFLE